MSRHAPAGATSAAPGAGTQDLAVRIRAGHHLLDGDFNLPQAPRGVIAFAHGSGSSRHSRRNRWVAEVLVRAGFATLLLDLLSVAEDAEVGNRFDITLLTHRLEAAVAWLREQPATRQLPVGLFGASTGAAAAINLAALQPRWIAAVVSRGGRPDLAESQALAEVTAPTLFIVGGADVDVLRLNRQAQARMTARSELAIVPGATHLFEEPGALQAVADLAAAWYLQWIR